MNGPASDPPQSTHLPPLSGVLPSWHSPQDKPLRPAAHVSPGKPPTHRFQSPWHLKMDSLASEVMFSAKYPGRIRTSFIPLHSMPSVHAMQFPAASRRASRSHPHLSAEVEAVVYEYSVSPATSTLTIVVNRGLPWPQTSHSVSASADAYSPTTQSSQADCPVPSPNEPVGQAVQFASPNPRKDPAAHGVQLVAPTNLLLTQPASHALHSASAPTPPKENQLCGQKTHQP
mmetsp:Transcript_48727/g.114139  ORF Transcript_48727/g.114139 Transcript_48727/m.114139 type:complete len:230 (-) Transcript_48727:1180-1869(-)